jgi:signal transduction histidine kinase/DNA-binding response OmpR family regulator
MNKLEIKLAIAEKKVELFRNLMTENDKIISEKINELENLILALQTEDSENNDESRKVYDFIREIQTLQNKMNEKKVLLNTSLKKVEELTLHYAEVDELKNEFLENTSHEIRTPLNAILGYLDLLRNEMYGSHEEMMEFINDGINSANRLLKLLNDIIDLSHADYGRLEIQFENVELNKVVKTAYNITKVQAEQKAINYNLNLPDENIFVRANAERVKQIFINLISNALKFTSNKGTITVNIKLLPDQNYVLCEVIDDGIGIAPKNITRIFEKFTQLESGTTRNYQGAGLGLSITKSLIELMGGLINVKSKGEKKGSTFSFTIPLVSTEKNYDDLNVPFNKNRFKIYGNKKNPLIAIIKDDTKLAYSIKEALLNNNYSVVTGNTADDGFVILKKMNPALIILGWALPRRKTYDIINGIELYKTIKSNVSFSRIPVIITTGHSLDYIKLFNPEISPRKANYFKKPFDIDTLVKRVDYHFKINTQKKNLVLVMENDAKVFKQIAKNIPAENYSVKQFDNYQNVLPFIIYNHCKKAILVFNPISENIIEQDIANFVKGELNNIDFSAIIIPNYKNYKIGENLLHITNGKVATITKEELFEKPEKIFNLIKNIK